MGDTTVGPTNGGHLIVSESDGEGLYNSESTEWHTGGRFVDSVMNVGEDLAAAGSEDFSATTLAIDGVVAGLDVLAFAANPFKEIIMAGLSWAIEHFEFLNEPLEMLTGSPSEISALSQTWANISQELANAAASFSDSVAEVDDWEGEAANAYRNVNAAFSSMINDAASAARATSNGIAGAGIVVATVRAIVIEIICDFVGKAIMKLLAALASAAISFGMSVAPALTSVIIDAFVAFAKITGKLAQLMQKIGQVINKLTKGRTSFGKLKNVTQSEIDTLSTALKKAMDGVELSPSELSAASEAYQNILKNSDDIMGTALDSGRTSALWQAGGDVTIPSPSQAGDAVTDSWENGLSWGAHGDNTPLRDLADWAGGNVSTPRNGLLDETGNAATDFVQDYASTALRGALGGVNAAGSSTDPSISDWEEEDK